MPKVIQYEAALVWTTDPGDRTYVQAEISRKQAFRIIKGFDLKKVTGVPSDKEMYSNGDVLVSGSRTAWTVHVLKSEDMIQGRIVQVAR